MSAICRFEPEARAEFLAALRYYALEANSTEVARRFFTAIESATSVICAAPELWRIVEPPAVRRYVFRHFPFVLYYRY